MAFATTIERSSRIFNPLYRALANQGTTVVLVTGANPPETPPGAKPPGVQTILVGLTREINLRQDAGALLQIIGHLRRERPSHVVYGTPKASVLTSIGAWITGVPQRIFVLHGLRYETLPKPNRYLLWATDAISARLSTTTVCVSPSLRDVAIKSRISPANKTLVMGHGSALGIDQSRFRPASPADRLAARSLLGLDADTVAIGYVGRLTNDKGITELATAFNETLKDYPRSVLIVAGPRDSTDPLPAWVTTWLATHPNVKYVGPTNTPEKLYHAIDVLVLPTKREGLGLVALEASASGVPVITTTATGARDAVVPFVTGLVVAPGDPTALGTALAFLIGNPDVRSKLGRMGPSIVTERFAESARIDDWIALLGARGRGS